MTRPRDGRPAGTLPGDRSLPGGGAVQSPGAQPPAAARRNPPRCGHQESLPEPRTARPLRLIGAHSLRPLPNIRGNYKVPARIQLNSVIEPLANAEDESEGNDPD